MYSLPPEPYKQLRPTMERQSFANRIIEQGGSPADPRDLETILTSYICIAALSILIVAE